MNVLPKTLVISIFLSCNAKVYQPIWSDLDSRPLPHWYDKAKVGICVHWGVYSVPAFGNNGHAAEWFWWYLKKVQARAYTDFMAQNYPPGFTYQEFASMFTAELFDPESWAELFLLSGARYIVLTSKHHDGYTLFPSKRSFNWNSVDIGPKRDIVGELSKTIRAKKLRFGLYYSLKEWFNPLYLSDIENGTRDYSKTKVFPEIKQIVEDYKPSILWADGDWNTSDSFWDSKSILTWLYNESPVKNKIVVNDRWGFNAHLQHGDFWNGGNAENPEKLGSHKWEVIFPMDIRSWGYRRQVTLDDVITVEQILHQVVTTVSCGGNALINIGARKDGTIPLIFQERLLSLGQWLQINGEAIYNSSPWLYQNDSLSGNVWYTCTKSNYNGSSPITPSKSDNVTAIYAICLSWPEHNILRLGDIYQVLREGIRRNGTEYLVSMLGENIRLKYKIVNKVAYIKFPSQSKVRSKHAWTVRIIPYRTNKDELLELGKAKDELLVLERTTSVGQSCVSQKNRTTSNELRQTTIVLGKATKVKRIVKFRKNKDKLL